MPLVKELGRTRIQVDVKVRSCFSDKQFATNVKIRIPVPKYTSGATCKLTGGTAKYKSAEEALVSSHHKPILNYPNTDQILTNHPIVRAGVEDQEVSGRDGADAER